MEIPKNQKIYQLKGSTVWISDEGIVYSKPKIDSPLEQTDDEIRSEVAELKKIVGNKKVCLIGESNPKQRPLKKEQRDLVADQINSLVKAMAIVTSSPVSRMMANLFFSFKPPQYPMKMFANEKDAAEWIRQYL
jgi:hypothetical protein